MRDLLVKSGAFVLMLFVPAILSAQVAPLCDVNCGPDPTSGTYGGTFVARTDARNGRGFTTLPAAPIPSKGGIKPCWLPHAKDIPCIPQGPPDAAINPGSQSYGYAIPILSLPGRNGLDLNLALFYNSRTWTVDTANNKVTFNADRDFPSYGFRLGFGYIEGPVVDPNFGTNLYTLTEPDGSKRSLQRQSSGLYTTVDSSYIDFNETTKVLRRKDGTQWTYTQGGTPAILRPTKITDTNGNFITIAYRTEAGFSNQAISTITDILGRVIMFNYDVGGRLTSITQGTKTWAYFSWNPAYVLKYSFASPLQVVDSPANLSTQNVLTGCQYPKADASGPGMGYNFTYGDWAIVKQVAQTSATGLTRSYVSYNYPDATVALSDHPAFTTETVFDGSTSRSWSYSVTTSGGQVTSFAVTDPAGTVSTTNLSNGLVSSVTLQNAGTLRTLANVWQNAPLLSGVMPGPQLTRTTTTLEDGATQSKVEYSYGSYGNVTEVREYDFGFLLKRKTQTDYLGTSAYTNAHILDRPNQVRVYDGVANLVARTDLAYDVGSLTLVNGAASHDDAGHGTSFTTRGNLTSTTRYPNLPSTSGAISRSFTYDTLGNLRTAQVDCCQQEQWTFSTTTQYAYPDTIVRGPGTPQFTSSRTYDFATGLLLTATDENNKTTSFAYDALNRLFRITRPDNVQLTTSFDDNSVQPSITSTTPIDATRSVITVTAMDGVGRVVKQITQDAGGAQYSIVETQYDNLGRPSQVSNPRGPSETPVWTLYQYDTLSRVTKVIPPDGSPTLDNTQFAYSKNIVTATDPAGKQRRSFTDGLGRLIEVDEPGYDDGTPGTGSVTISGAERSKPIIITPCPPDPSCTEILYDSGTVSITVNGFTAIYAYGEFDTPSSIAAGLRDFFNASSGSPVTATATSASVTLTAKQIGLQTNYPLAVAWTWDTADFTQPSFTAAASGSTLTGGADGTGANGHAPTLNTPLVTVYSYNPLDNLRVVTQGVQQRTFVYDSMGRLTSATTPEAGVVSYAYNSFSLVASRTDARNVVTNYSYDGLNRLNTISYTVPAGVPATPTVTLNYDAGGAAANANGRLTSMTDGAGSETYTYDQLGRITQLSKVISGTSYPIQYAYNFASELTQVTYPSGRAVAQTFDAIGRLNQIQSGGTNYLSINSTDYNAAFEPTKVTYGNGVQGNFSYNARLQLASLSHTKPGSTLFSLSYDYTTGVPGNNGQIQRITDNVDATRTTTYTYDAWARVKQASNAQWTITETYDRYGNRKSQSAPVANNITINAATNRITDPGYSYDAAGNMTSDGLNTLTYDAENRIVTNTQAGATTNYILDGSGLRVRKCAPNCTSPTSSTVYIFSGTKVIAEYDNGAAVASPTREYIYSGSTLVGKIESGATTYHHPDHLSARVTTDTSGNVARTFGHYPSGETWYETGTASKWKFTSYERDTESGNDYAIFRTSIDRLARFSSPDPVAGSIADPQSLNRYAYTVGDPINLRDPLGLYVNCLLDGQEVPCFVLSSLFRSMEFVDIARSFLGPNWVPSGGEYRNRGCYTNRVTDEVWCPGAAVSLFNMGDLSFLDDFLIDVPIDPCETRGGRRFGPGHRANDYHAPSYGTSVYTAGPGIVVGARSGSPHVSPPYNFSLRPPATNYVRVDLNSGYTVGYFHVTPSVAVGDTVPRGGILGTVDNSGRSTGPHVHVEVRNPLGNPVNPNSFFKDCN